VAGQNQQFTASVLNTTNAAVTWEVNGTPGGDATHGTISASGLYAAPATVPNPATVTVTAVSQADTTKSGSANVTISAPPAISVSVSPGAASLQAGTGTQAFAATLQNDTQNKGVSWSLSGAGCNGATCGALSGITATTVTYTAPAAAPTPATVTLTATSVADTTQTGAATITLTAAVSNVSVSITPARGGIAINQSLVFTATVTNDIGNQGVSWSSSGGSFTSQNSTAATFRAPASASVFTITATSLADNTKSATATIGVTDLAGVMTYHNDTSRDGVNSQEYALTTANVNSATFGKLFSCQADGAIYAQPLWVPNVTINGVTHNVVVVATQHDSVYVFDADVSPCITLWHANLLDATHGAAAGETTVPSGLTGNLVGQGFGDIMSEVGVTGTPVIDGATNTIYVVSKSVIPATVTFFQRLHALDLTNGSEKFGGPVAIAAAGFSPQTQNQRAGLALSGGSVVIAWASHEDAGVYNGWMMSYNATTLAQQQTFNDTPTGSEGGIWMSGGAPAVDSSGNLYVITGNGTWDGITSFGDSFLKMTPTLTISDWFTPTDQATDNFSDLDFGSGGATMLIDQISGPAPHLAMGGGKDQALYILNRDNLGHSGDANAWQMFPLAGQSFFTPAFWNNALYTGAVNDSVRSYSFNTATDKFGTASMHQSTSVFGFPGTTPSVSSTGLTNGIVWALDNGNFGAGINGPTRVASSTVLHAWDASNLTELWNSGQAAGDAAGFAVKFTVPTIANGKVYVGTRGNDDSLHPATVPGELDVYGLKP
jgi:hypothetical protein